MRKSSDSSMGRRLKNSLAAFGLATALLFGAGIPKEASAALENTYQKVYSTSTNDNPQGDKRRVLVETGRDDAEEKMYIRLTPVAGYRIQGLEAAFITNDFVRLNKAQIAVKETNGIIGDKETVTEVKQTPNAEQDYNFWNNFKQVAGDAIKTAGNPLEQAPPIAKSLASLVPFAQDPNTASNNQRPQLEEALRESGFQMTHVQSYINGIRAATQVQYQISCDKVQRKITIQDSSGRKVEGMYPADNVKAEGWMLFDVRVFKRLNDLGKEDAETFRFFAPIQKGSWAPEDNRVGEKREVVEYLPKDDEIVVNSNRLREWGDVEKLSSLIQLTMYINAKPGAEAGKNYTAVLPNIKSNLGKSEGWFDSGTFGPNEWKIFSQYKGGLVFLMRKSDTIKKSVRDAVGQAAKLNGNNIDFPLSSGAYVFNDDNYVLTFAWDINDKGWRTFKEKLTDPQMRLFESQEEYNKFRAGLEAYGQRLNLKQDYPPVGK